MLATERLQAPPSAKTYRQAVLLTSLDSCEGVDISPTSCYPLSYVCEENDSVAIAGRVVMMMIR
jgi:hypothetical protein